MQNMLYSNVSHEYKSKKLLASSRRESWNTVHAVTLLFNIFFTKIYKLHNFLSHKSAKRECCDRNEWWKYKINAVWLIYVQLRHPFTHNGTTFRGKKMACLVFPSSVNLKSATIQIHLTGGSHVNNIISVGVGER